MRIKDVKKTFNAFYIRFIVIITSLNMFKRKKKSYKEINYKSFKISYPRLFKLDMIS